VHLDRAKVEPKKVNNINIDYIPVEGQSYNPSASAHNELINYSSKSVVRDNNRHNQFENHVNAQKQAKK